jgi:xylan 1,4-beta-xylosidase
MGSPIAPNETQYRRLLDASKLATIDQPAAVRATGGTSDIRFTLPRQGVSLLVLDWSESR